VDPVSAVSPERVALGTWRSALAGERQPGNALGRIAWVRRMLLVLDAGATYWNDWVIGYGPDLQRALLDELGLGGAGRGERWTRLFLLSLGTLMTASLVLTLTLGWRRRRHGSVDPAARAFAAFSRRLEGAAVPARSAVETATAYGARAQAALPRSAGEIGAIVAAYLRARYEPDSGHASLAELTSLVRGFRPART
jgi:hypothetical protein